MKSEEFAGKSPQMKKDGEWLSSEDILDAGDVVVEIECVFKHLGAIFDEGRKEDVFSIKFAGKQRQLVLNNTNRKRLVHLFGTTDVTKWKGRKVTLYVDHNVRKIGGAKGETCCGIRVKAAPAA